VIERTATYETTGELATRWTGLPGFTDSTYFINFWQPLPQHLWGEFSAAELMQADESNRRPVGDGPLCHPTVDARRKHPSDAQPVLLSRRRGGCPTWIALPSSSLPTPTSFWRNCSPASATSARRTA
jgi:hypothetical protein